MIILINQLPEWAYGAIAGFVTSFLASYVFEWLKNLMKPINDIQEVAKVEKEEQLTKKAIFLRGSPADYYEFRLNKLELQLKIVFNSLYFIVSVALFFIIKPAPLWLQWVLMMNGVLAFVSLFMLREEFKQKMKLQHKYDENEYCTDIPKF